MFIKDWVKTLGGIRKIDFSEGVPIVWGDTYKEWTPNNRNNHTMVYNEKGLKLYYDYECEQCGTSKCDEQGKHKVIFFTPYSSGDVVNPNIVRITRAQYEDLCEQYCFEGPWSCKDTLKDILNGEWKDVSTNDKFTLSCRATGVKVNGKQTLKWLNKQCIEVVDIS